MTRTEYKYWTRTIRSIYRATVNPWDAYQKCYILISRDLKDDRFWRTGKSAIHTFNQNTYKKRAA